MKCGICDKEIQQEGYAYTDSEKCTKCGEPICVDCYDYHFEKNAKRVMKMIVAFLIGNMVIGIKNIGEIEML